MTDLSHLVTTTAGFGAGKAIVECMRELRLAGHFDAANLLSQNYQSIRAFARDDAAETAQPFAALAHADIISEAMR